MSGAPSFSPAPDREGAPASSDLPLLAITRRESLPALRPAGRIWRFGRWLPVVPLLVMLGGVLGIYFQPPGLRLVIGALGLEPGGGTDDPIAVPAAAAAPPTPAPPPAVVALGRLLPEGDVTVVAVPFGSGDARVEEIRVEEGDRVEAGAVLAALDNRAAREAAVARARAAVATAEATVAQARASVTASRQDAIAALEQARATARNAASELARTRTLVERGVAARELLEAAEAADTQAREGVARAEALVSRYGTGPVDGQPDVLVTLRALDGARADLRAAEEDLGRSLVLAPRAGTVLDIRVRPGERPDGEGVLAIGDTGRMTAEVEVYQSEIGRVEPGQRAEITGDAFEGVLTGVVARLGLEVARQTLVGSDPAASTDARVVKVTVALDEESSRRASRLTNLQVTARILVDGEATEAGAVP